MQATPKKHRMHTDFDDVKKDFRIDLTIGKEVFTYSYKMTYKKWKTLNCTRRGNTRCAVYIKVFKEENNEGWITLEHGNMTHSHKGTPLRQLEQEQ